jgi:hypothetical protein
MIAYFVSSSAAFVVSALLLSPAAQATKPQPADPAAKPSTITATIEAIDTTNRLVSLKGPKGNVVTVYADKTFKRFDELKVGDTITASYYESIAVNVRRPGDPAPPASSAGVTTGKGAMPAATAAAQETVTVTVMAIDRANQSVTVKRKDGSVVSTRVQNPKYIDMVKVGDTVDVTYTVAILLEANRAK